MTLWKLWRNAALYPGGRFYSGLEQLKTYASHKRWQLSWNVFTAWRRAGAPQRARLGISGVKSLW
ncbi:hypothetical protein ACNKHX_13140 [Shigella flexneri]